MIQRLKLKEKNIIQSRIDTLTVSIRKKSEDFEQDIYEELIELYGLKRKLDSKYSFTRLSEEVGIPYTTVTKILGWRLASPKMKQAVKEKKILRGKANFILQAARGKQDEVLDLTIKNNLTEKQIKKLLFDRNMNATAINEFKDMASRDLIAKSIITNVTNLKRSLLQVHNVPTLKVDLCLATLRNHKELVEKAIHKLEVG